MQRRGEGGSDWPGFFVGERAYEKGHSALADALVYNLEKKNQERVWVAVH
jgi:hypothetical protein